MKSRKDKASCNTTDNVSNTLQFQAHRPWGSKGKSEKKKEGSDEMMVARRTKRDKQQKEFEGCWGQRSCLRLRECFAWIPSVCRELAPSVVPGLFLALSVWEDAGRAGGQTWMWLCSLWMGPWLPDRRTSVRAGSTELGCEVVSSGGKASLNQFPPWLAGCGPRTFCKTVLEFRAVHCPSFCFKSRLQSLISPWPCRHLSSSPETAATQLCKSSPTRRILKGEAPRCDGKTSSCLGLFLYS